MARLRDWIDDRTGYRGVLHALLLLNFPVSRAARWRYVWGGALALMLVVELVTGTLLMTVYSPSEAAAWGSVQYLETQVGWGWFIRGVHHYTSHMMLVVILLHTLVVVLTAGYRKPKEFTFWSGLIVGGVVLALAISGNPLPWDQKGYWDYQIETGIAGTMPLVGSALRTLLVGGSEFGNLTLTRLYTLHVVVLPVFAVLLLAVHVALMRREKLRLQNAAESSIVKATGKPAPGDAQQDEMEPYWPYQSTRNLLMFGVLMGLVVAQTVLYPKLKERHVAPASAEWEPDLRLDEITLEAPADRDIPYVARPEWYVRFLYELRDPQRGVVDKEQEVLVTGVLPMVIVMLMFLMPFFESVLGQRLGHGLAIVLLLSGLGGMLYLTFDGLRDDHTDAEYQRTRRQEINYAGRSVWLARQNGIPPEGPATLLHNDAKAMGPLLFAANCAKCHSWSGHDGTGQILMETVDGKKVPAKLTASDLFGFASKDWIAEFLANPTGDKFFGRLDRSEGGDEIKHGEMADWAADYVGPDGVLTAKHLQAVAALLAREANRPGDSPATNEQIQLGVDIFSGAELKDHHGEVLEFDGECLQCHTLKAGDPDDEGGGEDAPILDGYGSKQWLMDFIRDPGAERFHGEANIMPHFDRTQLSDHDLALLVDWIRGDWPRATVPK